MTKTIEEAARKQIHELSLAFTKELHDDATIPYHTCKDALTWLFDKHLRDRLTAEEKEMVKVIYNDELGMGQHFHAKANASNDISCRQHYYGLREPYISRMKLLERIFGEEFFKE